MKIIIKTKNLDLTNDLKDFIEKKFYGLKKFIEILKRPDELGKTLAEIFVGVERSKKYPIKGGVYKVKSRIYLSGKEIVARIKTYDLKEAIIEAKNELKSEIERHKGKISTLNDEGARKFKKDDHI